METNTYAFMSEDFSGTIRSLRDLEILYIVFADLFISYPCAVLGFVVDVEKTLQESDQRSIFEFMFDSKGCLARVMRLAENMDDRQRVFKNLHLVIQQYALNIAYERGTAIIRQARHEKAVVKESWYRIMKALRNASMHGGKIESRSDNIFKKKEERIEWNDICLEKSDLGGMVTERMVQDNAVWKLIFKMEETVKNVCSDAANAS